MILILILSILMLILGLIANYVCRKDKDLDIMIAITICLAALLLSYSSYNIGKEHGAEIGAKAVYQGKTTLQITYQDSIPVDSVVVFKKVKI